MANPRKKKRSIFNVCYSNTGKDAQNLFSKLRSKFSQKDNCKQMLHQSKVKSIKAFES